MSSVIFSITVTGDDGIVRVNSQWFNKNTPTDVISFSMVEKNGQINKYSNKQKSNEAVKQKSNKANKQIKKYSNIQMKSKVENRDQVTENGNQTTDNRQLITDNNTEFSPKMAGEIIVNEDEVRRNAEKFGVSFEQEMARVVAHGVLHVYGHEDDTEEKRQAMKSIEDIIVEEFGD